MVLFFSYDVIFLNFLQLPPIRSRKNVEKQQNMSSNAKPKKLKSYDYRSWDKLDVVRTKRL